MIATRSAWMGFVLAGAALGIMGLAAAAQDGGYGSSWWSPGEGRIFPETTDYENSEGQLRVLLSGGAMPTQEHAFFTPLEPDGRACVTCHQPADGMALSAQTARRRWDETDGKDPLFSSSDGSNCPTLPKGVRASHSLLLDHGLIRIQRPWPPKASDGTAIKPDFTLEVVRDPWGCESGPFYGLKAGNISVYRRPRPVANLKYATAAGFSYDPKDGMALRRNAHGGWISGNLMADGRSDTLDDQMREAGATHLRLTSAMTAEQRAQIADFEARVFTAQQTSRTGGALDSGGATGGPQALKDGEGGRLGSIGVLVWSEFAAWDAASDGTQEQNAWRQSVARGAKLFRERTFLIDNSTGIHTPPGFGNPVRNSCVFCHNMSQTGMDVAPGQVDIGTTTEPYADAAPHLPLFRITCQTSHRHYGRVIYTTDPGFALTTGRCADVGRITVQNMRGMAGRAPYFANGSAKDAAAVIDYYDRRYRIGYTAQERQDLINLLNAL